ncbi:MAG: xylulokinase [Firmicutes bacterium]|nr:xylulokinase [Bacillota bacterium]
MYLGVDLGTSSLKVLLCDNQGLVLDTAKKEYESSFPNIGYSEQNPQEWLNAFVDTLKELSTRNDISQIKAISFCGHMHGLVMLDSQDNVIRPCLMWNDTRSIVETDFINNYFGEKLLDMVGNIAFAGFTAPKLLWIKNNEPENFKKIAKIMLPKDYLLYASTGIFASDVSDNSGTLYFDVQNKSWQQDMLSLLGINQGQLPKIFESYQVVGNVCSKFAKISGLSINTKIVAGGGDQAVGAIGTGTVGDGNINISLGTSGVVFASCNNYAHSDVKGLHSFAHSDGKYHFMGCTLGCAASVDFWLQNVLNIKDYNTQFEACKNIEPTQIVYLPYISGERSPINNPIAKGTIHGLQISHTRHDITRAVVEGVCFSLKDCLVEMQRLGINAKQSTAIGGLTQNPWILQILSTILNLEIRTLQASQGGAFGAVILAMVGDELYNSVKEACKELVKLNDAIVPDTTQVEFYNAKFAKYKELYKNIKMTY